MRIEQLRIRNYRALQDVTLTDLPPLAVFVGRNGTGKSTLFDVFGFLRDALQHNVRQALARRGGYREVVSRGREGQDIEFELKFREEPSNPLVTYELHVGLNAKQDPIVKRELLKYRRGQYGRPWHFLDFREGTGQAVVNEDEYGRQGARERREEQNLDAPDILAIKGLGQFQRFRQVASFRKMIENWHVSDFHIAEARPSQEAGYAEHLSAHGDNLPLVAQYLYERHPEVFRRVLSTMQARVPGVSQVDPVETADGRLVLKFQDGSFKDPFIARYVSDGTIKMFAYLILLYDPQPHPILCVEEPENQLYPELLVELAEEFRQYTVRGGQVFASTHSPDFLNGTALEEIFWLEKSAGYPRVRRARDDEQLAALVAEGDLPGMLWRQGVLHGSGPRASEAAP
ncbi:MAG: AAA family ATPase [Proteobacteria bacterium]|nr:AAA family ATPase [Pseudomonadota bacterium]